MIRGAAQHNLQHVDVDVPREKMSVFCGPSGSGKTSLAMDTLYAEGQRRYVESLSAYARQFLGQMPKPKVEHIHGLSPAIAIEQKAAGHSPRSTVGTVTEIYDYLRILYARLGKLYCPECDIPVETQTSDQIVDKILALPAGVAADSAGAAGSHGGTELRHALAAGAAPGISAGAHRRQDRTGSKTCRRSIAGESTPSRSSSTGSPSIRRRGRGSPARSKRPSIWAAGRSSSPASTIRLPEDEWIVDRYSLHFACHQCGRSFEELTPNSFSFNSPLGWCPACEGLGDRAGDQSRGADRRFQTHA